MTRVNLTGGEIHALRDLVRQAHTEHSGDDAVSAAWRRREGALLQRAVDKMTAQSRADTDAVLRGVLRGHQRP